MDRPLNKEYPGLPANHFPSSPVTVHWLLDTGGDIQLARKGFPVVPNFSTTVDGATGKTLETSIPDLGSLQLSPTFTRRSIFYFLFYRPRHNLRHTLPEPYPSCSSTSNHGCSDRDLHDVEWLNRLMDDDWKYWMLIRSDRKWGRLIEDDKQWWMMPENDGW